MMTRELNLNMVKNVAYVYVCISRTLPVACADNYVVLVLSC